MLHIYLTEFNYKASKTEDGERKWCQKIIQSGIVFAGCVWQQRNRDVQVSQYRLGSEENKIQGEKGIISTLPPGSPQF